MFVMLDIQHCSKQFQTARAVNDVSLSVEAGHIYALIGPNGSGKTTLLQMIAGLLKPDSGTITVDGYNVLLDTLEAKQVTGYIPDNPVAWSAMTGEEFLHVTGALYGLAYNERRSRIRELLPAFRLQGVEKAYFEQYSRGNKQKFAILAALLHKPKLLLIDEPIVGLDPHSVDTVEHLLRDFIAEGGAVLMATHTLPVAERTADMFGLLQGGNLVASDTLGALKGQADLREDATLEHVYMALAT
jgi:ABC-2 type transport system ATP-binding protein